MRLHKLSELQEEGNDKDVGTYPCCGCQHAVKRDEPGAFSCPKCGCTNHLSCRRRAMIRMWGHTHAVVANMRSKEMSLGRFLVQNAVARII